MKLFRSIAALVVLALAVPAAPATTYALIAPHKRTTSVTCTTGTEAAPSAATDGMDLSGVSAVDIIACADSGQTITTGVKLDVYLYDEHAAAWALTDWALSIPTGKRCGVAKGQTIGKGFPIYAPHGRITALPNAMAVSAGNITVYLVANGPRGIL